MNSANFKGLGYIPPVPYFDDATLQAIASKQAQTDGKFDWNKFLDTATKIGVSAAQVVNTFKQSGQLSVVDGQFVPASGYLPPPPQPQDNTMKIVLIGGGIAVAALATWAIVSASQNNNKKK
jgi:hypothetical protein